LRSSSNFCNASTLPFPRAGPFLIIAAWVQLFQLTLYPYHRSPQQNQGIRQAIEKLKAVPYVVVLPLILAS
jgi:hypothetical protein